LVFPESPQTFGNQLEKFNPSDHHTQSYEEIIAKKSCHF